MKFSNRLTIRLRLTLLTLTFLAIPFFSPAHAQYKRIPATQSDITYPNEALPPSQNQNLRNQFQTYIQIPNQNLTVPTVLEIPLTDTEARSGRQLVYEYALTNSYQPFRITSIALPLSPTTTTINDPFQLTREIRFETKLTDNNPNTYVELLPHTETDDPYDYDYDYGYTFNFHRPITSNSVELQLPSNVELPDTVTLYADNRILLNQVTPSSSILRFPQTIASSWQLNFTYSQNLRISEIEFSQVNPPTTQTLRFLARPGETYRLYLNSDSTVNSRTSEPGNLMSPTELITLSTDLPRVPNPMYQLPDRDNDGVPDETDNCPYISNPSQTDRNNDRQGDACQDFDGDGVYESEDNCPEHPNRNQQDSDNDGIGDHCDPDESRLTERLAWLPWVGIALGFGVVLLLFRATAHRNPEETSKHDNQPSQPSTESK